MINYVALYHILQIVQVKNFHSFCRLASYCDSFTANFSYSYLIRFYTNETTGKVFSKFQQDFATVKVFTTNDFHYIVGGLVVSSVVFCELVDRINDQRTSYGAEDKCSSKQQIHD